MSLSIRLRMDRQKGKKTNNSEWTEKQEDTQLSMDRNARRQTIRDGQKDKKTVNSG
jgi:hypothetical protein